MDEKEFIKKVGGIDILWELSNGERGFSELKKLDISPGTLSERLKEALSLGLVEQVIEQRRDTLKPKVVYRLTEKGMELIKSIEHLKDNYLKLRKELKKLKEEVRRKEEEIKRLFEEL